jgi:hypothetical protein
MKLAVFSSYHLHLGGPKLLFMCFLVSGVYTLGTGHKISRDNEYSNPFVKETDLSDMQN